MRGLGMGWPEQKDRDAVRESEAGSDSAAGASTDSTVSMILDEYHDLHDFVYTALKLASSMKNGPTTVFPGIREDAGIWGARFVRAYDRLGSLQDRALTVLSELRPSS